jgi:hypothetical protein
LSVGQSRRKPLSVGPGYSSVLEFGFHLHMVTDGVGD